MNADHSYSHGDQDAAVRSKVRRYALPLLIVLSGIGIAALLVITRRAPARKERVDQGMLVEVISAEWQQRQAEIAVHGTVKPQREVSIAAQVAGTVTWVHPELLVGNFVKEGQPLVRIDDADYRLNLDRAHAALALAEQRLAEAESNAAVARQEWDRLGRRTGAEAPSPLTLHKPQLKAAKASYEGALADVRQAKLNLSRTLLRAPFNARIRTKNVDVGQYVRSGEFAVTLYGTDTAEIEVPLPLSELPWIEFSRADESQPGESEPGAPVIVRRRSGSHVIEKSGRLVRSMGEIDKAGRMTRLVVVIDDPFNLQADGHDIRSEFEIGAFVEVFVPGRILPRVIPIPAHALQVGSNVLVANPDNTLSIKTVEVARRNEREALITAGLDEGDRIITTPINGPVTGMKLRVRDGEPNGESTTSVPDAAVTERTQ